MEGYPLPRDDEPIRCYPSHEFVERAGASPGQQTLTRWRYMLRRDFERVFGPLDEGAAQ